MKKYNLTVIIVMLALIIGAVSCEKTRYSALNQTDKAMKILELEARMNALNSGTGKMTNFMSVIGYSQYKTNSLSISSADSVTGYPDSGYVDTTNYWQPVTCAKVTDVTNPDSSHTTVYDYGDGCNEYGAFTRGKITYLWKTIGNSYSSEVIYDHYYSYGMEMNGISKYTFTSDGNSWYKSNGGTVTTDSSVSAMPVVFNWSGTSTAHEEITMKYDSGNVMIIKSDFTNIWDSVSYKVTEGDSYYSDKDEGYLYHYQVKKPLITSYKCTGSWVPVSGIESISTTQNGVTNEYLLDYGDGTCDNVAMLTENGKTSKIDFGDIYRIMEPQGGQVVTLNSRGQKK